jgi:serine/threonine protein phosphatase PrpC
MIRYTVSAIKDKGNIRDSQQDYLLILPYHFEDKEGTDVFLADRLNVFIIADGMGGTAGGEIASKLAVNAVKSYFDQAARKGLEDYRTHLTEAIHQANQEIISFAGTHPEDKDMGTTIVIALIDQSMLHVAWVGDSRCYGVQRTDSRLIQISKDHSYVQMLIDDGKLDPELAYQHPNRNLVTRSLGMKDVQVDYNVHDLSAYSYIYLCSDGINSMISDSQIHEQICQNAKVETLNKSIVQAALDAGGDDNISSILIAVQQDSFGNRAISATIDPYQSGRNELDKVKSVPSTNSTSSNRKIIIGIILLCVAALIAGIYFLINKKNQAHPVHGVNTDTVALIKVPASTVVDSTVNSSGNTPGQFTDTVKSNKISNDTVDAKLRKQLQLSYYIRLGIYPDKNAATHATKDIQTKYPNQKCIWRKLMSDQYEVCIVNFESQQKAESFMKQQDIKEGVIIVQKDTDK